MRAAVVGASGYAGTELLRLLDGHPDLEVALATAGSRAGMRVAEHSPSLAAAYPDLVYASADVDALAGVDVAFLALPHGESQDLVPGLIGRVSVVVDLAADFRLQDPELYPTWYGAPHRAPELLSRFVTGLPELYRDQVQGAQLIAVPGCYPTAVALALAPLARADLLRRSGVVIDAVSGTSGAGRGASDALHFGAVSGDFRAYGLLSHRHTPEMEQEVGDTVLFTPHLAPMTRGILATCYARPADAALDTAAVTAALADAYRDEPFVTVTEQPPSTKNTVGSNCAHVTARVDPRTGWVVALSAIDNLMKGAAGQALQCANLALGLPETTGLSTVGLYP